MKETVRILEVFGEPLTNGGQESYLMNMYRNFDRNNVQIDFFTPYFCDNFEMKDELEKLGCNVYSMNGKFNITGNRKDMVRNTKLFFKEHKYNTVHIHSGSTYALMMISKIARKSGSKNVIIHSHCGGFKNLKYKVIKTISTPYMLRYPTHYFACSRVAAEWKFPKKIIKEQKYQILKNAIDTSKFFYDKKIRDQVRKELNVDDKIVFGHVGRITIQKNHNFLIDIFYEILKKQKNAILLIVGEGPLKDEIKDKVRNLKIEENVMFLGLRSDVDTLYNAMDALILPSFFEGLPMVGVEAEATGLPVFASTEITRELPIEKLSFYYSLNDSANNWSDNILKVMRNYSRCSTTEEIKSVGFDVKIAAKRLEKIYEDMEKKK